MDNHNSPVPTGPAGHQDSAAAADLWRFVPLADYRPPSPPVSSAASRTWSSLAWLFGGGGDKAQPPVPDREELQLLSPEQLARQLPGVGDFNSDCTQAGRTLQVAQAVRPTPNPRFRRVDVTVSERGHSVVRVTTIVGNN